MKKTINLRTILIFISGILIALTAFISPTLFVKAAKDYRFTIQNYDVIYDINSDRSMTVTENITILYQGANSTGFYRDIPINDKELVKKVSVYEIINGVESQVAYYKEDYEGFYSLSIGDYSIKTGQTHEYKIVFDYAITRPKNDDAIFLNAIGYGWDCEIYDVDITLNLPEGLNAEKTKYYVGNTFTDSNDYTYNNNAIYAHVDHLAKETGVTFDLYFESGILSTYFDFTPYYFVIAGLVILVIVIALKFLKFTQLPITPVVNFTAPDEMDPLVMGKYIDNHVSPEDITSLIYYWASKGYLQINLDNPNDPILIQNVSALPMHLPQHQITTFNSLFSSGSVVQISSLANKFYVTIDSVTRQVNTAISGLYTKSSSSAALLFSLIGAVFISLVPVIATYISYGSFKESLSCFFMIIPALLVYAIAERTFRHKHKYSKNKLVGGFIGAAVVAAVCTAFYVIYVNILEYHVIDTIPLVLTSMLGFASVIISATFIERSEDYTKILNNVVGFKNFILYAEKDRLEAMLEADPQLYYHVLPYANVLGVTDIWEDKFKDLTLTPPTWLVSNGVYTSSYYRAAIFSRAIRTSNASMFRTMSSRPSPKGGSGFGGRGGRGGFGGGGG
ncbi:MAG: DUF2207 domain-containing protein, partial [Clostridia bacterium]|nr:DUF2207 domain-containing protein [Clostridia bacterium]